MVGPVVDGWLGVFWLTGNLPFAARQLVDFNPIGLVTQPLESTPSCQTWRTTAVAYWWTGNIHPLTGCTDGCVLCYACCAALCCRVLPCLVLHCVCRVMSCCAVGA